MWFDLTKLKWWSLAFDVWFNFSRMKKKISRNDDSKIESGFLTYYFLPFSICSLWREFLTSHFLHHRRRFGIYSIKALLWSLQMAQSILILIQSSSEKFSPSYLNEYEWEIASCLKYKIKIFRISLFIIYFSRNCHSFEIWRRFCLKERMRDKGVSIDMQISLWMALKSRQIQTFWG